MSSTNVVPHPELVGPLHVRDALEELVAAGVIGQDAFNLGVQVLHDMARNGSRRTIYTGSRASRTYTMRQKRVYAGALSKDIHKYIEALQDLQVRAGIMNSYAEPEDFSPKALNRHFTANPALQVGKHYTMGTPINFVLPSLSINDYQTLVSRMISTAMHDRNFLEI